MSYVKIISLIMSQWYILDALLRNNKLYFNVRKENCRGHQKNHDSFDQYKVYKVKSLANTSNSHEDVSRHFMTASTTILKIHYLAVTKSYHSYFPWLLVLGSALWECWRQKGGWISTMCWAGISYPPCILFSSADWVYKDLLFLGSCHLQFPPETRQQQTLSI